MQQRGSAGVWRHGTLHGGICMHHGTCMNSGIVRTNMLYIMPGFGRTDVRMGMPAPAAGAAVTHDRAGHVA